MACPPQPAAALVREAIVKEQPPFETSLTTSDEKSACFDDLDSDDSLRRHPIISDVEADFPEGGLKAWLCVAGAFASTFSTFGYLAAWGAFQAYYEQELLPTTASSTIAWIGSTQYAITYAIGVFMGRLFDIGIFHIPLLSASVVLVTITVVIGQCTKFWQLFLCQGVILGLSTGVIFGPTMAAIAHWFKKRRGIATGITVSGAPTGGIIFPIMLQRLIQVVGFPWAMRIIALLLFMTTSCVNLFLRRRLPPVRKSGGFFDWKAFRYAPFSIYTASTFMCFLGFYTVLTYIDVMAAKAGIAPSFDVYFLAICNGSSAVGRVLAGILADRVGAMTVMIPGATIAAVVTYAWPSANNFGSLLTISILYGLSTAAYSINTVPVIFMGETADVGRRTGTLFTIGSFAVLAGAPLSGFIAQNRGLEAVGFYAGSCIMVSAVMMLWVRYLMTGRLRGGKF